MSDQIKEVRIEYCGEWGFYPQASSLVAYLANHLQMGDEKITLIEGGAGIFQVMVNDSVVFDNKRDGAKFPTQEVLLENIKSNYL